MFVDLVQILRGERKEDMKWLLGGVLLLLALLLLPGLGSEKGATVNVIGSTSVQPFAEMLAEEFNRIGGHRRVEVQGGGSTAGLQAALNGVADIGMCSRSLKEDEAKVFQSVAIARDGLSVVVHPSNRVDGLTKQQVERIFAGEITNWAEVGGEDRPIRLITREEGSGTREAFVKLVMGKSRISPKAMTQESNGSVKELVRNDSCAIGYMSLGLVGKDLKALKVDGVEPTAEQVMTKKYPLVRPFLFVTKSKPGSDAQAFIDYVLSVEGQQMLVKEGLVRVQ